MPKVQCDKSELLCLSVQAQERSLVLSSDRWLLLKK